MSAEVEGCPSYSIVSPVRDEAQFLLTTARSLVSQTVSPDQWVIVDDGSADDTGAIVDRLAQEHEWIVAIHRPRRATRERGGPIVRAFEDGFLHLSGESDVVVKLDGDLHLPAHYFEWVLDVFAREPRAGIVGGTLYIHDGHRWVPDEVGRHTVHGAVKAYRTACLNDIGGLHQSMGWDGIDEYAARARDWRVLPLSELAVLHYKRRGSKQGWPQARWEEGLGAHYMGYGRHGIAIRTTYRCLKERPRPLAGLVLLAGYLWATLNHADRCRDDRAIALMRREQAQRFWGLVRGRGDVAPDRLEGGGPALWTLEDDAAPMAPSPALNAARAANSG